jgi:hypothetical protein
LNWWGLLILFLGLLFMVGTVLNWGWFMNSRRSRLLSRFITETGTRMFYILLGIALIVWGIMWLVGVID